jgi:hypothetical protein
MLPKGAQKSAHRRHRGRGQSAPGRNAGSAQPHLFMTAQLWQQAGVGVFQEKSGTLA